MTNRDSPSLQTVEIRSSLVSVWYAIMIVNESGDVFGDQVYFGTGAYDLVIRIKTQWSRSRPGFGFLAFPCISCFSWLKCRSYLIVFWSFGISSAFMVRSNCSIEILGCWCDFSMICDLCLSKWPYRHCPHAGKSQRYFFSDFELPKDGGWIFSWDW